MRYLSDVWIAATASALAKAQPLDTALTVGYIVTDGPEGDRRFSLRYGTSQPTCLAGVNGADVTLQSDWNTAVAIAQGTLSPQRAFLDGHLRLDGDAVVLIDSQAGIVTFETHLAPVRAATTYT